MAGLDRTAPHDESASLIERLTPPAPHGFTPAWLRNFKPPAELLERNHRPEFADRFSKDKNVEPTRRGSGLRARWESKTFFYRWWVKQVDPVTGKVKNTPIVIGPADKVALDDARRAVRELKEAHREGKLASKLVELGLPWGSRREDGPRDGDHTVAEAIDAWLEKAMKPVRGADGRRMAGVTERQYKQAKSRMRPLRESAIGKKRLIDVRRSELIDFVTAVAMTTTKRSPNGKHGAARTLLRQIRQCFDWAADRDWFVVDGRPYPNPASGLTSKKCKLRPTGRDRVATPEEIVAVWTLAERTSPGSFAVTQCGYRLLLLLGIRSKELRLNRWENVDWTGQKFKKGREPGPTLRVPKEIQLEDKETGEKVIDYFQKLTSEDQKMKAKDWFVPLSPAAVGVLEELRELTPQGSPWILSSVEPGHEGEPLADTTLSEALRDSYGLGRMSLDLSDGDGRRLTPHDFRRTFTTGIAPIILAQRWGRNGSVIEKRCQNHAAGDVHNDTYNRYDYIDERRTILTLWAQHIFGLLPDGGAGGTKSNVVRLSSKRSA